MPQSDIMRASTMYGVSKSTNSFSGSDKHQYKAVSCLPNVKVNRFHGVE